MRPTRSDGLPLVSIVTPVLNEVRYVAETVESVLGQDYPNIEYLLVDGGSTDGTLDVLRNYPVQVISLLGSGQSQAINEGWRRSRGDIVTYLPGDDWYAPGAVSKAVDALQGNPRAAMVYGDVLIVDARDRLMLIQKPGPFNLRRLLTYNYIPQPTTFMRRSAVEQVGFLDEALSHHLDYDLWLRLGCRFEVAYITHVLGAFRIHPASVGSSAPGGFGADVPKIMAKLRLEEGLKQHVPDFETLAECTARYYRAAAALQSRQPGLCRQELIAIACLSPSMIFQRHIWRTWLKSFAPRALYRMQWTIRDVRHHWSKTVRFSTLSSSKSELIA